METETLLAVSAGATFLLALAAFWAIWQTRGVQRTEKRERLLNEIIEWAIDISNNLVDAFFAGESGIPDMKAPGALGVSIHLREKWNELSNRSEYIKMIATKLSPNLGNTVSEISKEIEYRKDLWTLSSVLYPVVEESELVVIKDIFKGKQKKIEGLSEAANNRLAIFRNTATLRKALRKLIKRATKLKIAG